MIVTLLSFVGVPLVAILVVALVVDRVLQGFPSFDARGKSVLITGASSGIGASLARSYAKVFFVIYCL